MKLGEVGDNKRVGSWNSAENGDSSFSPVQDTPSSVHA